MRTVLGAIQIGAAVGRPFTHLIFTPGAIARIEPTPFEDDEGMVTCYGLPVFLEREAPADGRALRVTVDGAGYALVSYDTD